MDIMDIMDIIDIMDTHHGHRGHHEHGARTWTWSKWLANMDMDMDKGVHVQM